VTIMAKMLTTVLGTVLLGIVIVIVFFLWLAGVPFLQ